MGFFIMEGLWMANIMARVNFKIPKMFVTLEVLKMITNKEKEKKLQ